MKYIIQFRCKDCPVKIHPFGGDVPCDECDEQPDKLVLLGKDEKEKYGGDNNEI